MDHAPGPSRNRLIPTSAESAATVLNGREAKSSHISMTTWPAAAIGVQKPAMTNIAISADAISNQAQCGEGTIVETSMVPAMRESAAQIRRAKSPTPGQEVGKMEKSLCIVIFDNRWKSVYRFTIACRFVIGLFGDICGRRHLYVTSE